MAAGENRDTLGRTRAAEAAAKAREASLRLKKAEGALVDRAAAEAHVRAIAEAEGRALLDLAGRIGTRIAAALSVSTETVVPLVESEMREHIKTRAGVKIDLASD